MSEADVLAANAKGSIPVSINAPGIGVRWCKHAIVAARDGVPHACD